jgi:hypothetical protein
MVDLKTEITTAGGKLKETLFKDKEPVFEIIYRDTDTR